MIQVGSATRAMIPDVAVLMARNFGQDITFFTRMLDLNWGFGFDEIGKALFDGSRLVGFFGLHHSRRTIRSESFRITAMHGVVVESDYRGAGTNMLTDHAVCDPDSHYIAWTANPAMNKRYRRAGFKAQNENAKLVWPASTMFSLLGLPFLRQASVDAFDAAVDAPTSKIFRDHCGSALHEHLFFAFGKPLGLITRRTYYQRKFPITELAYVNDPQLLRKVFEPVRLIVHRRERTAAMMINPAEIGFSPFLARPARGAYLYKSSRLGPGDFHLLYGEMLLLK